MLILLSAVFLSAAPASETPKAAPGDDVFDPASIHRFRITIPEEGLRALEEDRREYVRATLREGDEVWADAGVRLKGSAGSERPLWEKSGITIKFDKFVPARRYRSLRKVVLNNAIQDPSYLSDLIGNELFRAARIPAPRIGFARVEVNGRDMGFYLVVEAITRDFLARWFRDSSGNLYEGPGEVDAAEELDVDSHAGTADRTDLRDLAEAAVERTPKRRMERLAEVLDIDRFFAFTAMEVLTWHWDGYAIGRNNYHLYHDPGSRRFVFFPHGLDQLFGDPAAPAFPEFRELGLVTRAVLSTIEGRRRYREHLASLLPRVLDPDALRKRIEEISGRIRPHISGGDEEAAKAHEEAVASFIARIEERARFLREEIDRSEPSPRQVVALSGEGKARPSVWEPRVQTGEPDLARSTHEGLDGAPALRIHSPPSGDGCASWRTRILLPAGRYRFSGKVRTKGVEAVEAEEGREIPSGAGLRISGKQPEKKLLASHGWTRVEFEFAIEGPGEFEYEVEDKGPVGEVELVCELRASRGSAWFDEKSLEVARLKDQQ